MLSSFGGLTGQKTIDLLEEPHGEAVIESARLVEHPENLVEHPQKK
jgi:hypothetical protein